MHYSIARGGAGKEDRCLNNEKHRSLTIAAPIGKLETLIRAATVRERFLAYNSSDVRKKNPSSNAAVSAASDP